MNARAPTMRDRLSQLWLGAESSTGGPETPTLLERLIGLVPLPYAVTGVLLAAAISAPGRVGVRLLHGDLLQDAMVAVFPGSEPEAPWQRLAATFLWFAITFYAIWVTRYGRRHVVAAEDKLVPLLPAGAATYRRVFSRVTRARPALLVGLVMAIAFTAETLARLRTAASPADWVYQAASTPLLYFIYGTAVWAYVSATWSLYRLGQQPLKLKSPAEDEMLGARPMGALSLALSFAGFGQIGLMTLVLFASPVLMEFQIVLIGLAVIGVVMFFLPLYSVHQQMVAEKKRHQSAFRRRVFHLLEQQPGAPLEDAATSDPALTATLAELRTALALQTAQPTVAAIPTWPVDTGMLRRLGAVAGSIIVAVITNIIVNLMRV
jgi:hypothetical protein